MVIPPRAPSPHSGALSSQGQTGLYPLFFQKPPSPWDSPPPPISHSHHNTHTHTPPTRKSSLGFDGLHSPAEPRFSKLCLWWKAERRWWCWRREVSLARAALICRKPSWTPCENRRGSRATGAVWAPALRLIRGTGPNWWRRRAHGGVCVPTWGQLAHPPPGRDTGLIIPTKTAAAQTPSRTSTRKLMSAARLKAWTTQQLKVGKRDKAWGLHATAGFLRMHGGA